MQLWIYFKLLLGLVQFYSMFELADYVLVDQATSTQSTLRKKVIAFASFLAALVLTAYLFVAIQMG
jgi:hypothetical protein